MWVEFWQCVPLALGLSFAGQVAACSRPKTEDAWAEERRRMVKSTIEARGVKDLRVLGALGRVPRHLFVPEPQRGRAYADEPLPIGWGQTISQPYIVALMTEAVAPKSDDKCLEIGTGSGYQAAILAELCATVFSIEYLPELAKQGEANLRRAGYAADRVQLLTGDGYQGWPEVAPFGVIVVTAAPPHVPEPLLDQLAVGGRMVIPLGPESEAQELKLYKRVQSGRGEEAFSVSSLADVRFVPFLGPGANRER